MGPCGARPLSGRDDLSRRPPGASLRRCSETRSVRNLDRFRALAAMKMGGSTVQSSSAGAALPDLGARRPATELRRFYSRRMRLVDVHVQRFRNVLDSTVIPIDEQVTCLVGKNESGKTTLLHALWRLNPHVPTSFETTHDYPRWRLVADRKAKAINDVAPVTAVFELDAGDVAAVEALVGHIANSNPSNARNAP